MQCVFYTGTDLRRRNLTPSFIVRTAYFHPVIRKIAPQKEKLSSAHILYYILKSNRDTALRF